MKRGFSLIEVVVSSAVVFALVGMTLVFLKTTLQESSMSRTDLDLQQCAQTALRAALTDLGASDINSVNMGPGPATAASPATMCGYLWGEDATTGAVQVDLDLTPAPNPNYGFIVWQQYRVLYYQPADRTLRLAHMPLSSAPTVRPIPYRINAFAPVADDPIIGHNIDSFGVWTPSGTDVPTSNPLTVAIACTKMGPAAYGYPGYRVTLQSDVVMANSSRGLGSFLNLPATTPTPLGP